MTQGFLLIEYFFVLFLNYFIPELGWMEFLFIPVILLEFGLLCSLIKTIIVEILLGMFGAVLLSNHMLIHSTLSLNNVTISVSFLSACFYIPLSITFIFLAYTRAIQQKERDRFAIIENTNHRLEAINNNINQKLFSIQQDSSNKERMRITKEIHDTAGYVFINIIMLLQTAVALLDSNKKLGLVKINEALDYTRRGVNEIRYILREMQNYEKPSFGLQNELYEIAKIFMHATEVLVIMEYGNWPNTFGPKLNVFFTSFLQEGLTNALKHGYASKITMSCWIDSSDIMISLEDNGRAQLEQINYGIGLTGIQNFVDNVGGKMYIEFSQVGFIIRVSIPIEVSSRE